MFNNHFLKKNKHFIDEITSTEVVSLLSKDFSTNVQNTLFTRNKLQKISILSNLLGNTMLYIGTGLSTAAGAITMIGDERASNIVLFTGIVFYAIHIIFIGVSKCAAKEERIADSLLVNLANEVGFHIIPIAVDNNTVGDTQISKSL